MKTKYITAILLALSSLTLNAQTYLETVVELSARDALSVQGDSIYASNYNNGVIYRIENDGTIEQVIASNARGPAGTRFDSEGNMYVAMYNAGAIVKLDPQGNETVFASNVQEPIALDWDPQGNLYVSHFAGPDTVSRISSDGLRTPIASIPQLPYVSSLCLDDSGDIYVTSYESGDIYRVTPSGDVSLFTSTDLRGYAFIQFDHIQQRFYATAAYSNTILSFDLDGEVTVIIDTPQGGLKDGPIDAALTDSAIGLAISNNGKHILYATDTHIRRLNFADPSVDQVKPYFTSSDNISATAEEALNFTFDVVDPNNDPLTLSLSELPDWLTFDGIDQLNGTPPASDSETTVVINAQVTDGLSITMQTLTITVAASTTVSPPAPAPAPAPTPEPVTPAPDSGSGGGTSTFFILGLLIAIYIRSQRNTGRRINQSPH